MARLPLLGTLVALFTVSAFTVAACTPKEPPVAAAKAAPEAPEDPEELDDGPSDDDGPTLDSDPVDGESEDTGF